MSGTGTKATEKKNMFARLSVFLREVVAELRKVIWPTRSETINWTGVVLVFVLIMAGIVAILDFGFGDLVLRLFGS